MGKLHLGVGMPGNIPGMLRHSAAQATAMNGHHCISVAKALVRENTVGQGQERWRHKEPNSIETSWVVDTFVEY